MLHVIEAKAGLGGGKLRNRAGTPALFKRFGWTWTNVWIRGGLCESKGVRLVVAPAEIELEKMNGNEKKRNEHRKHLRCSRKFHILCTFGSLGTWIRIPLALVRTEKRHCAQHVESNLCNYYVWTSWVRISPMSTKVAVNRLLAIFG